jgi:hypothetical protein
MSVSVDALWGLLPDEKGPSATVIRAIAQLIEDDIASARVEAYGFGFNDGRSSVVHSIGDHYDITELY